MNTIKMRSYIVHFIFDANIIINKTEDSSLLRGRVMFIKENPDRRFCCLPHVPGPRTDQSLGL